MARTAWSTLNQVSGQSAYTGEFVKAAEQVIEAIKPLVEQKKYLRNLFDKAYRSYFPILAIRHEKLTQSSLFSLILMKFMNSLVRSRPLGEIGAEQVPS